jgi:hypothetical protein
MDSYNANLTLIDAVENIEINLTGLPSRDYTFNYTPKITNGETAFCDNRFFIRISKTVTGIKETIAEKVNVYETNGHIQVIAGASNPIKEVAVYNLQGVLLYKETLVAEISHTVNKIFPDGMYIIRVTSEKGVDTVKVVKK